MDARNEDAVVGRIHSIETFGAVGRTPASAMWFFFRAAACAASTATTRIHGLWAAERSYRGRAAGRHRRYRNFIKNGGVTLSGGEPLLQPEFAAALLRGCRKLGFHTALDTAGSVPLEVSQEVIDLSDLLLLDVKSYDPGLCEKLTGSDNAHSLALKTLEYCESAGKPVWIRHVLVPGYTLSPPLLEKLAEYLSGFSCIKRVDLLPFHKMGEYKWRN
jgi:pyruvate formate lyase activating enzyme